MGGQVEICVAVGRVFGSGQGSRMIAAFEQLAGVLGAVQIRIAFQLIAVAAEFERPFQQRRGGKQVPALLRLADIDPALALGVLANYECIAHGFSKFMKSPALGEWGFR
ncbi:hypothetical protein D3C87_1704560 [compost metagenome]